MKELALFIFKNIVDNPDKVNITESVNDEGGVVLTATVAEDDMGKVIGKSGKVINAIRQVLKIAAIRQDKRVNLTLAEPEGAAPRAKAEARPEEKSASGKRELASEEGPAEEAIPSSSEEKEAEPPSPEADTEK